MLVLIGVAPAGFVVNMNATGYDITRTRDAVSHLQQYYQQHGDALSHAVSLTPLVPSPDDEAAPNKPAEFHCDSSRAMPAIELAQGMLTNLQSYDQLTVEQRSHLRRLLMCVTDTADKVAKLPETSSADQRFLKNLRQDLLQTVEYAPMWIIVAVALALSLGTMVGWKRVATTIGEDRQERHDLRPGRVGPDDRSAVDRRGELYRHAGLHHPRLSSAVAGTMIVDGGGVQSKTVKNILLAWVLTLPISILLSGALYWVALKLI